ncbi:MAG: type II toxin-antitoxin system prevent-host-death family antitoxin [Betaproteobacteria bacterium]|jgi:prevent-host-death family protein|nr:type II toxin-antitoxin system prevent-host-death family antitoxin [Betaproteobacteria bacterium]
MQVQLAEIKNKLSEYVKAVQQGQSFEITVRGVPVAQLMPMSATVSKTGFAKRVQTHMESESLPVFDVQSALLEGRR